jgi:hypothetical protein
MPDLACFPLSLKGRGWLSEAKPGEGLANETPSPRAFGATLSRKRERGKN